MTIPDALTKDETLAFEKRSPAPPVLRSAARDRRPADPPEAPPRAPRPSPRAAKRSQLVSTVIVDKSALFRAGLAHILGAGGRFRVVAGCSSPRELPEGALKGRQSLALVGLDDADGAGVLSEITAIRERCYGLSIIVLSEQCRAAELLAVIEAGASGYLLKSEITPEALLQSIELVLLGGVVIPQGLGQMLKSEAPSADDIAMQTEADAAHSAPAYAAAEQSAELARLSSREQMILMQLTQGASNKHIARALNIAEATVKVHVKSLLRKIRVNNRTQAAMWAIETWRKLPSPMLFFALLLEAALT